MSLTNYFVLLLFSTVTISNFEIWFIIFFHLVSLCLGNWSKCKCFHLSTESESA